MSTPASTLRELNLAQKVSETDDFTERRYHQFAARLQHARKVLDVGCGVGRGGRALRATGPDLELDGVEFVPERVAAIPDGIYDQVFTASLEDIDGADAYDAIVAGELIEHIPYDKLDAFLGAVRRLLAPGGVFLLTTPNPHYFLLGRRGGGSVVGGSHVSVHCPEALAQYLRYREFHVRQVTGSGRMTRWLGERWPLLCYGSYLLVAQVV